jgi:glyoxylase-like metal-dependent hydrolase (beta-lactamase superfamily II)
MRLPFALFFAAVSLAAAADLRVYAIDVEGGKSTLYVSPSGESMLVDTGYDGFDNRDADRIVAAAHDAGIRQIDYLVITHYHKDHMGGVPQLAAKISTPTRKFAPRGSTSSSGPAMPSPFTESRSPLSLPPARPSTSRSPAPAGRTPSAKVTNPSRSTLERMPTPSACG